MSLVVRPAASGDWIGSGAGSPARLAGTLTRSAGKYRCFVDGQVVYSEAPCLTIKSKEVLAREAREAEAAETAKRKAEAVRLEATDRPNFERRILLAQRVTARYLRDPDSARFDRAFVSWFSGNAVVCGLVTGRNGFGGYGQPVRFVTWDDWVTLDDGKIYKEFDKHWSKYCGPG
jgi:hypothetical protein